MFRDPGFVHVANFIAGLLPGGLRLQSLRDFLYSIVPETFPRRAGIGHGLGAKRGTFFSRFLRGLLFLFFLVFEKLLKHRTS